MAVPTKIVGEYGLMVLHGAPWVDTTGPTINNVSVDKRKSGNYGRLWVGGRYRGGDTAFDR